MIYQLYLNTAQGFGDFIRTCLLNYIFFKRINKEYSINFQGSTVENCFKTKEVEKTDEILFGIIGNKTPLEMLSVLGDISNDEIKDFKNLLTSLLRSSIKKKIKNFNSNIGIHARLGDHFFLSKELNPNIRHKNMNDIYRAIHKITLKENDKKIHLFTDSQKLKELITHTDINITTGSLEPTHTAFSRDKDNSNAIIEFFQLMNCEKIYSFVDSNKINISAFSFIPALLGNVEILTIDFDYTEEGKVSQSNINYSYPELIFAQ